MTIGIGAKKLKVGDRKRSIFLYDVFIKAVPMPTSVPIESPINNRNRLCTICRGKYHVPNNSNSFLPISTGEADKDEGTHLQITAKCHTNSIPRGNNKG